MAMSPSPQLSPIMGGAHRVDRTHNNSPPLPLSKRDKRRHMLADRLEEITKQFSHSRDAHYREQLQAIQIDMNLIMEADVHGKEPLKDQAEDIENLVHENVKSMRKSLGPHPPQRAGRMYADFAKEINDALEEKDAALVVHKRNYEVKMAQIVASHAYRRKLAASEYSALSSTLRDRLINSVTNKKNRLSRDKETVEIGDSNALLLHPSQYGLANPASPGGIHGKRATRHRREADEISAFPENNKRKRKAGDSDESPGPTRQRLENGNSTPIWFNEKRELTAQQIDSPLYSVDKLFTEKELSMTYNTAALAAHQYIQRHAPYYDTFDTPPNGQSNLGTDDLAAVLDPEADDVDSPLGGAGMERQYSHATRSTRGVANFVSGIGIDAISDLNFPGNMHTLSKQIPKMPPLLASMNKGYVRDTANQPIGLSADESAAELDTIRRARAYNQRCGIGRNLDAENGGRALLEAVAVPRKFDYWVKTDNFDDSHVRDELPPPSADGEAMSRGPSDLGGVPMSRTNTGEGATSSRGRKIKPNHNMS